MMKMNATIAVPVEDDKVFQHFGHATKFKIYKIEEDVVTSSETCDTGGVGHEDLAIWLVTHGVNAVLCGGIGPGALGALAGAGIATLAGVDGAADTAIAKLIDGTLEALQNLANCGHHGGCGGGCGGGHCGGGHHGGCGGHCGGMCG